MQLHLRGLSKRYPGVAALDTVDLDIASGELIALLGPSGSGKTTLLRVVAGLLSPDTGRVLFGERDATRLSLRERNVGFVFQHYALFRHMTVADNIAFGLRCRPRARRPTRAEIARRVEELLGLLERGHRDRALLTFEHKRRQHPSHVGACVDSDSVRAHDGLLFRRVTVDHDAAETHRAVQEFVTDPKQVALTLMFEQKAGANAGMHEQVVAARIVQSQSLKESQMLGRQPLQ